MDEFFSQKNILFIFSHAADGARKNGLLARIPLALGILLLAFTGLVLLHSLTTPLFEAPDEAQHYAYLRWIAEGHGLPSMEDNSSGANQEVSQPPLYYLVAALFSAPFNDENLTLLDEHNPNFGYQSPGNSADNKNMLIHTDQESWPWSRGVLAVRAARFTSWLFGLLTVIAAWGLGYETFGNRKGALLTAALVAFQPQFIFLCGVASNDSASAALAASALWSAARILRHGLTLRRAALAGMITGLALLTKTSALPLLGLVGLALLAAGLRRSPGEPLPAAFRRSIVPLIGYSTAALLTGGSWYLRNFLLYGDPIGLSNHLKTLWGRPAPISLFALWPEYPLLIRSFWAAYGWGHIFWPDPIYLILSLAGLTLLVWGTLALFRRPAQERGAGILAAAWFFTILALLLQWMREVEAPHGRLLFPALAAWALLLAAGMLSLPRRLDFLNRSFLLLLALLAALAPGARLLSTFALPRLYNAGTLPADITPIALNYNENAALIGLHLDSHRLHPGDNLSVRACWKALQAMEKDYSVFIHLLGPQNQIVASRHTYPGLGRLPTSHWPLGQTFCDTYRLTIDPQAETPLRYRLEIGLFIPETQERMGARAADGTPLEPPIVAAVDLVPARTKQPTPEHPLDARLGTAVILRGADYAPMATAGQAFTVTLHWNAVAAPEPDLIAFVHLWNPGEPQPFAQNDAPPRGDGYPTAVWQPGDEIPDIHQLEIPADLPPGRYPLWAGLYRATDGTRLTASGAAGPYPYDLVPLGEIEIQNPTP